MTTHRGLCAALLVALWMLLGDATWAADLCQPRSALSASTPLEVRADDPGTDVWLEARLVRTLRLSMLRSAFGMTTDGHTVLTRDVLATAQVVGRGTIQGDRADLKTYEKDGSFWLRAGTQRYLASVVDHVARGVDGNPLQVSPNLDNVADVEIAKGAGVTIVDADHVIVEPGAIFRWKPGTDKPLKMFLLETTRLAETSPSDAGISGEIVPLRAPAHAKFVVQMNVGGLDMRAHPPTICFAGRVVGAAEEVRFVRQEGDIATFEMRLPQRIAESLVKDASWWERVRGVPAKLRAIAYVDSRPAVDLSIDLHISSARWAAAVGVAVLILVYLTCAALMRKANPLAIIGGLIRESSGRFSLSNLQVLLWSLLVIFALTFSWISTGQLLTLSASVLGLLGIAGSSSVLARSVERMDPESVAAAAAAPVEPSKGDLVNDKDGKFDLLRFQMLGFTIFALAYSLWSVLRSDGLPDLPDSLYWLMGISNITYVGGKAAGLVGTTTNATTATSAASAGAQTPAEQSLAPDRVRRLQKVLGVVQNGTLDDPTREAVTRYKLNNSLYPVNGRINDPLLARLGV